MTVNYISGRIFAADSPSSYKGDALYSKIKADLDLSESLCALPSGEFSISAAYFTLHDMTGEFSMWLGNTFNYETKTWSGHGGDQIMGVNLTLIKAGRVKPMIS